MKENIKTFIYYGSENYISLSSLRRMVPAAYLFLSFLACVAGIVGGTMPMACLLLTMVIIYSAVVYTFHIWCPKPSFSCRFAMSAFSTLSLSLILQFFMYTVLWAAKGIVIIDIIISFLLQFFAAIVYFLITKSRISKGAFKAKKSSKTNLNISIISGAAFAGTRSGRILRGMDTNIVITVVLIAWTCISVLLAIIATMHLMKFCYCKKYNITCNADYQINSPLLTLEQRKKKGILRKIWSVTWKLLLLLLLVAIRFEVNQSAQEATL